MTGFTLSGQFVGLSVVRSWWTGFSISICQGKVRPWALGSPPKERKDLLTDKGRVALLRMIHCDLCEVKSFEIPLKILACCASL